MGIGTGSGEGRAVNAARHAITSPLLEASIEGARGILLNIAGGSDLTLFEVNEAAAIIHDVAHPDANIIFGNVVDESLGDLVRVTVIAAGFDRLDEPEEPRRGTRGAVRPTSVGGFATSRPPTRASQGPGSDALASDPSSRGDLPEVFPSSDDLSNEPDVFGGNDDDDLDDDFDVPSFLK
jgi:cell division protein FtsZ